MIRHSVSAEPQTDLTFTRVLHRQPVEATVMSLISTGLLHFYLLLKGIKQRQKWVKLVMSIAMEHPPKCVLDVCSCFLHGQDGFMSRAAVPPGGSAG